MTLFVVPPGGASAEHIEERFADLRAAAPARYRVEQLVCRSDPLPRTATGKVRRSLLGGKRSKDG